MRPRNASLIACLIIVSLITAHAGAESSRRQREIARQYRQAVRRTAVVTQTKVPTDLVPLTPDNPNLVWNTDKSKVLVVAWKSQYSYDHYIAPYTQTSSSEANVLWVTPAPYIHEFCHRYFTRHPQVGPKGFDMRLKQRLGLNPAWEYDVFVELWVSPEDLFRPCVDPETNDSSCNLDFGSVTPHVKNIADYPAFYKNLYFMDYRRPPGLPWTGMGYTCDWLNGQNREGESEFIISPSSRYEIKGAVPTREYCRD